MDVTCTIDRLIEISDGNPGSVMNCVDMEI